MDIESINVIQIVATLFSTLSIVVSCFWALCIFRHEISKFERTIRSSHYSELDSIYAQLLGFSLERPYLRDPMRIEKYVEFLKETKKKHGRTMKRNDGKPFSDEAMAYSTYAFMAMNFVETIRDRCHESGVKNRFGKIIRPNEDLRKTWEAILDHECELHNLWFEMETLGWCNVNPVKFCLGFCDFVWCSRWKIKETSWGDRDNGEIRSDDKSNTNKKFLCRCEKCC